MPLPNSTPNVPKATIVPASQPDGSTPGIHRTPYTSISPTDTPTTPTTPDTTPTTPDTTSSPNLELLLSLLLHKPQMMAMANGNGNGNNGNGKGNGYGKGNNGTGKGKGKSGG